MTEILCAFVAGMLVASYFRRDDLDPGCWLREIARAGVTLKARPHADGGWTLSFIVDERHTEVDHEEVRAQTLALCNENKKVEAIRLVKERLGLNLTEAKKYVDALL